MNDCSVRNKQNVVRVLPGLLGEGARTDQEVSEWATTS
jgi:hypothetical protein